MKNDMVKRLVIVGVAILTGFLPAQSQTLTEWDNVSVTNLNRLRAHTLDIPMESETEAAAAYTPTNALEASPWFLSLNGTWKFKWAGTPEQAHKTFYQDNFNASSWETIDVPSTWQVYGLRHNKQWDKPLYCNTGYPFSYDSNTWSVMADRPGWFTYKDSKKNPVGSYRREFTLPETWDGRRVFLRFNGAGHGYYVWVNGQFVGYAEDSYLPSEWDVTDKVRAGVNNVSVRIYRFTSGSFLECQDYWRLTGITRDVYLWSAPQTYIRDFFYRTTSLSGDTKAVGQSVANAALTVWVGGASAAGKTVEAQLLDGTQVLATQTQEVTAKGQVDLMFNGISGVTAWSAERPKLYDLVIKLTDGTSSAKKAKKSKKAKAADNVDVRCLKVGFRTVSVRRDGALLVNGNPVIFHGVDRHSFSENGGRTLTKAEIETDLLQMKRLNVNGIRTSHYPNNPYLYDLCDRLGIYVLAEADVECHGNTGLSSVEAFRMPMVERNVRHVLTLRNHASIVIWSAGNESGGGNNFQTVMDSIGRLDPTRLTHYEGNSTWSSVTSTMYGNLGFIESTGKDRLRDYQQGKSGIRPHVQCENTHAMGNSMGNQREYYDLYEKYPALCGEFVWDWKDQGLKVSSKNQPLTFEALGLQSKQDVKSILDISKGEYWAYGGDFGDNPNDGNFCCNGVVLADNTPTAKSYNMKKIYQPIDFAVKNLQTGTFTLKSKLQQRTLDDVTVNWFILEDGIEVKRGTLEDFSIDVDKTLDVTIPAVAELEANPEAEYFLRFTAHQKQATEWADAGFEVAAEEFQIREATGRKPYSLTAEATLEVTETGTSVTVKGANFEARFASGQLASYKIDGKTLLSAPLTLQVFRLPTDNERGRTGTYDELGLRKLTLKSGTWQVSKSSNGQSVDLTNTNVYTGSADNRFEVQQSFKVLADGVLVVNASVNPVPKGGELPRLGLRTELPKGFETMRWLGRGPQDSYVDRREAALIGLHHSRVSDEWTNYVLPQEQGNKEEVRWMALANDEGQGLLVVAPKPLAMSAGHWRPEDNYTTGGNRKKHPYEMTFCQQTVLNIDAYNRALGNASCGPDVIDQYRVRAAKTHLSFLLMPLAEAQTDEQLAVRARVASPVCAPVDILTQKGVVTLTCPNPDATIYYTVDGGAEQAYTKPFNLASGGLVSAFAQAPGLSNSPVNTEQIGMYVNKSKWRVVSVSSQQGGSEVATNVLDENPSTIWHTQYSPSKPGCPHEIVVDMAAFYKVAKFVYQGREDMSNGRIKNYEFYVSSSATVWGAPMLTGTLQNTSEVQEIELTTHPVGRYFRVVITSTHDNQGYVSAAELGIIPESTAEQTSTHAAAFKTTSTSYYYLRHKTSGLFLHYLSGSSEGAFALGKVTDSNLNDLSYCFHFGKLTGYTAYFTLNTQTPKQFMTVSGWHVNATDKQDTEARDQWLLVEQPAEATIRLRGAEMGLQYFNFDRNTSGSFVYSNKATAAEFEVINKNDIGKVVAVGGVHSDLRPADGTVYDLNGRRLSRPATKGVIIVDGEKRVM